MNTAQFFSGLIAQFGIELLQACLPIVVGFLVAKVMRILNLQDEKIKLDVEAQLRDVLHGALGRALQASLVKHSTDKITTGVVTETVQSLKASNPETLSKLGVNDETLTRLIMARARISVQN